MDDTLTNEASDLDTMRRWRRRVGVAALLVLAVAVLALIPPLVNVNRYQRRISATLSASLGRPVHLDSVTLHLLPFPGFTLTNFVVSEDPAFGAEPTIRANSVEAHVRLSSLWRRRIEISRVRFLDPSLNLVRNPQGRWNLDNILVNAARIDAAPTGQQTAGETPRFPYIEATGARLNIKLGDEKMPFSLTDADFALWLPTAQQWRVRLVGRPSRTDANISDPGTLRIEGALQHAARLEDVPVDLQASWHDAPLGEATRLMTGDDMGWRGTVHIDASLQGPLGAAAVRGKVTLDGLRRADFVPAKPLDLAAECSATADAASAQLRNATCALPVLGATPVTLSSAALDLGHPLAAPLTVDADKLPLTWVFGWLKVLSPRVPAAAEPAGGLTTHLARSADQPGSAAWSGGAQLELTNAAHPATVAWTVAPSTALANCPQALVSSATALPLRTGGPVTLGNEISLCGYELHASGTATQAELKDASLALPQLTDGLETMLPTTENAAHFDITCTRSWGAGQACVQARPAAPPRKAGKRRR